MAASNELQSDELATVRAQLAPLKVFLILPAGGSGLRAEAPTPKQYWAVEGQPLLYYTLRALEAVDWLQQVLLPVAADMQASLAQWLTRWGFNRPRVLLAGSTRHRWVRKEGQEAGSLWQLQRKVCLECFSVFFFLRACMENVYSEGKDDGDGTA